MEQAPDYHYLFWHEKLYDIIFFFFAVSWYSNDIMFFLTQEVHDISYSHEKNTPAIQIFKEPIYNMMIKACT